MRRHHGSSPQGQGGRVKKAITLAVLLLSGWIAWDMVDARTHNLRTFDGREVARLETATWRSYYDHHPIYLFAQLTELLRRQYRFPFWRSVAGSYYAAHAAEVFQAGHERADYMRALPDLVKYYALIRRTGTEEFDVNRAAALELEWWIVHRERKSHPPGDLERSLAELQAAIYSESPERLMGHAQARAEAMLLRDRRADEAGAPSAEDWNRINELLNVSWLSLVVQIGNLPRR
jgi:hypothetical protein